MWHGLHSIIIYASRVDLEKQVFVVGNRIVYWEKAKKYVQKH